MTEKIADYFSTSLHVDIRPVSFLNFAESSQVARALFRQEVQAANYVFSGPGSPSYAVHQWRPVGLAEDLKSVLRDGGVVCFASAAALTIGQFATTLVYEIYKVGECPLARRYGRTVARRHRSGDHSPLRQRRGWQLRHPGPLPGFQAARGARTSTARGGRWRPASMSTPPH